MAAAAETPQLSQEIRDRILSKDDDPLLIPGIGVLLDPEYIAPGKREKAQADLMRGNPYFVVIAGRRYYGESPEQAVQNAKDITAKEGINAQAKGSSGKGAATTDANGTVRTAPSSGFMGRTWNATKRAARAAGSGVAGAAAAAGRGLAAAGSRTRSLGGRVAQGFGSFAKKRSDTSEQGQPFMAGQQQNNINTRQLSDKTDPAAGTSATAAPAAAPPAASAAALPARKVPSMRNRIAGAAGTVGRGLHGMTQKLRRGRGATSGTEDETTSFIPKGGGRRRTQRRRRSTPAY